VLEVVVELQLQEVMLLNRSPATGNVTGGNRCNNFNFRFSYILCWWWWSQQVSTSSKLVELAELVVEEWLVDCRFRT
jgi:hypothetical protein